MTEPTNDHARQLLADCHESLAALSFRAQRLTHAAAQMCKALATMSALEQERERLNREEGW